MPWDGSLGSLGLAVATDHRVEDRLDSARSKTFRTRVLCVRCDPRALLIFFGVYTGYAMRRVKLSGFLDRALLSKF